MHSVSCITAMSRAPAARSLGNARKRPGESPARYRRRDIFVSRGTAGNYPAGNNGNGGLDGGINYGIELNECLLSHPAPFFGQQWLVSRSDAKSSQLATGRTLERALATLSSLSLLLLSQKKPVCVCVSWKLVCKIVRKVVISSMYCSLILNT